VLYSALRTTVYRVVPPNERREVVLMDISIGDLIAFGMLIIALLAYIDRINKHK
jgi:hypothetical protein